MPSLEGPDQGSAWVVAFAACIINMILSGISRMVGMLYVAVIDAYGVSREEATLPFTLRNAMRCLAGPLVGVIGQRYGIRSVTLCGGVIAALGVALCSIAPSVLWLTVFWGGLHGIGFAFANTLFQVVVNQYFEKHRTTASGIALSGACFGSFAFPFIMEALLEEFGLHGTFLILGGVIMNVLPPALFLRSPPWLKKSGREDMAPTEVKVNKVFFCEDDMDSYTNLSNCTSMSNNPVEEMDVLSVRRSVISDQARPRSQPHLNTISSEKTKSTSAGDVLRKVHISESLRSPVEPASNESKSKGNGCLQIFKSIVMLFTNPIYVLINIGMATYIIIFIPILTVLVDYSEDKGFPAAFGKYLINCMAIGDLVGRLCFGWITDRGIISTSRFMTLTLVAQGTIVTLFPQAKSVYSFMGLLALYGMTAGSILVQFPVLVFKYVSVQEQAVAMGCVGFLSGIVSFAIPPLIGHFRDNVGSYDGMFYITGGLSLISGGIWILEPILVKWCKQTTQMDKS